jgi:TPP-dependent pyruvate/acetoin dehydrogenase alpha subunit
MLRIRRFEERLIELHAARAFRGHFHVSIGQESGAVAACGSLAAGDVLFTTHRNHAHLLARGADPVRIFAEILGRRDGYNGGRGGTLHVAAPDLQVPVTSALVGGSLPLSVGAAVAAKRRRTGAIVVSIFGDAALEEGAFYESLNLAALWSLPILLVCDNNSIAHEKRRPGQYPSSRLSNEDLTAAPAAFGVPAVSVEGADVDELDALFTDLRGAVREEGRPRFVEVRFDRWPGNYDLWPTLVGGATELAWAFDATPPPELAAWCGRADPILREARAMVAGGIVGTADLLQVDAEVQAEMDEAADQALAGPLPDPATAHDHVLAAPDGAP